MCSPGPRHLSIWIHMETRDCQFHSICFAPLISAITHTPVEMVEHRHSSMGGMTHPCPLWHSYITVWHILGTILIVNLRTGLKAVWPMSWHWAPRFGGGALAQQAHHLFTVGQWYEQSNFTWGLPTCNVFWETLSVHLRHWWGPASLGTTKYDSEFSTKYWLSVADVGKG